MLLKKDGFFVVEMRRYAIGRKVETIHASSLQILFLKNALHKMHLRYKFSTSINNCKMENNK